MDRLIQQAVQHAQEYARQGYQWVVDLDKELERRGQRFCRYADDSNMHLAYPKRFVDHFGPFSLLDMLRLHWSRPRAAVYGTVRTVV